MCNASTKYNAFLRAITLFLKKTCDWSKLWAAICIVLNMYQKLSNQYYTLRHPTA